MSHCVECGACCASFRVSFYWSESTLHPDGHVPESLITPINSHYVCMKGTEKANPRCVALDGKVGEKVSCAIYDERSSTCREFEEGSEACHRARQRHGLTALPES